MPTIHRISLDTQKFPFSNQLIRLAVVHVINSTEVLQTFSGLGLNWIGPIPQGVPGYAPDLQPYSYNLTLARIAENALGYVEGIARVSSPDVPAPFSPPLQNYYMPSRSSIIEAVKKTL